MAHGSGVLFCSYYLNARASFLTYAVLFGMQTWRGLRAIFMPLIYAATANALSHASASFAFNNGLTACLVNFKIAHPDLFIKLVGRYSCPSAKICHRIYDAGLWVAHLCFSMLVNMKRQHKHKVPSDDRIRVQTESSTSHFFSVLLLHWEVYISSGKQN